MPLRPTLPICRCLSICKQYCSRSMKSTPYSWSTSITRSCGNIQHSTGSIIGSPTAGRARLGARSGQVQLHTQEIRSDDTTGSSTESRADIIRAAQRPEHNYGKERRRAVYRRRVPNGVRDSEACEKHRYLSTGDAGGVTYRELKRHRIREVGPSTGNRSMESKPHKRSRRKSSKFCRPSTRNAIVSLVPENVGKTTARLGFKVMRFYPRLSRHSLVFNEAWRRRPNRTKATRIQKWIVSSASLGLVRKRWASLRPRRRYRLWSSLVVHAMGSEPCPTLIKVLLGTYTEPFPASSMVSHTVDYIIRRYLPFRSKGVDHNNAGQVLDLIHTLWRLGPQDHLQLRQTSIDLINSNLPQNASNDFLLDLIEHKQTFSPLTLSLFAHRLAKSGDISNALKVVKLIGVQDYHIRAHSGVSGLWTTILQKEYRQSAQTISDYEIVDAMRSSGVKQNIHHYNVLLHNVLQDGDYGTGQQIFKIMSDEHIGIDAVTYSILLNDAKCRMDRTAIESILKTVKDEGIKSLYIITDLLHIIFLLHRQEQRATGSSTHGSRQSAFERMLPVFSTYHNCNFLRRLIPELGEYFDHLVEEYYPVRTAHDSDQEVVSSKSSTSSTLDLTHPAPPSLCVMLAGFLEGADLTQVRRLFSHFHRLVETGDPAVAGLSETSHAYNYFLMAFGKHGGGLPDCINLVELMLSSEPVRNRMELARSMNAVSVSTRIKQTRRPAPAENTAPLARPEIPSFAVILQQAQTLQPSEQPRPLQTLPELPKRPLRTLKLGQQAPRIRTAQTPLPKPCVYTWSILLNIFMRHSQPLAAEKVLNLMLARDIRPSIVTWDNLISGYSRMQNPAMTADAVYRMEQAGFEKTERINIALAVMKDRERYWDEVMKRRAQGRVDKMMDEVLEEAVRGKGNDRNF